jgi:hypothetical protein
MFPRTECEAALRAAQGDTQLAFEFLESGHVPTEEEQQQLAQHNQQIQQLRASLQQTPAYLEDVVRAIEARQPEIRAHPELLLQNLGLDPAGFDLDAIRNRTAQPIGLMGAAQPRYGLQPGYDAQAGSSGGQTGLSGQPQDQAPQTVQAPAQPQGPAGGPQAVLSRFPQNEKETILRLRDLGDWPLQDVIEAFVACDKDENATANLLFSSFQDP